MVYRLSNIEKLCVICESNRAQTCQNCSAPFCTFHLQDEACYSCLAQLWTMERRVRAEAGGVYGVVAAAIAIPALWAGMTGAGAAAGFAVLTALLLGYFMVPGAIARLARPLLARKKLPFTPVPRLRERRKAADANDQTPAPTPPAAHRRRRPLSPCSKMPVVIGRGIEFR